MRNYTYTIISPGGNTTALVHAHEPSMSERIAVNTAIIDKHIAGPQVVEQVGFIGRDPDGTCRLTMAGGEFCGNATRAAAWYFLQGKPGSLQIAVSGMNSLLTAGVDEQGEAYVILPLEGFGVEQAMDDRTVIHMPGITHVVMQKPADFPTELRDQKDYAFRILQDMHLDSEAAAGVMFTHPIEGDSCDFAPIVYVRDAGTLFYESACGSGTAAIYVAARSRHHLVRGVVQPSGARFTLSEEGGGLRVQGPVDLPTEEGAVELEESRHPREV